MTVLLNCPKCNHTLQMHNNVRRRHYDRISYCCNDYCELNYRQFTKHNQIVSQFFQYKKLYFDI
jgi:hypothetical protein